MKGYLRFAERSGFKSVLHAQIFDSLRLILLFFRKRFKFMCLIHFFLFFVLLFLFTPSVVSTTPTEAHLFSFSPDSDSCGMSSRKSWTQGVVQFFEDDAPLSE